VGAETRGSLGAETGLLGTGAQPARALLKLDRAQKFAEFGSRSMP